MKKTYTFTKTVTFTLKETDVAVIGVITTIALYVMNVFGTGVIVGGDVGHIDTGNDLYACMIPAIWTVFAVLVGYLTKRNSMPKAFKAIYITMLLPFISYPLFIIPTGPLILIPMYLCMPVTSLFCYLDEKICDILGVASYSDIGTKVIIFAVVLLIIPIITAPLAYRFTVKKDD